MSDLFTILARRIRLIASRAVLRLVDDAGGLQSVQITLLADETRDGVERFQDYGFTSIPHPGAEGVAIALGGSRDHLVAIAIDDRRYRLRALAAGEVALYDDLGHQVHLTRDGIVIHGGGHAVTITGAPKLRVEGSIEATGEISDRCDTSGETMAAMRDIYDIHTHPGDSGGVTGVPQQAM